MIIRSIYAINEKKKDVAMGILNRKANAKLNLVVNTYEKTLTDHWKTEESGFLCKKISCENLHHLKELKMSYFLKDQLFARSYDLIFEFEVPAAYKEEMSFALRYAGKMKIKGAHIVMVNGGQEAESILEELNNPLIISRLLKLDLINLAITYSVQRKEWLVRTDSLIGSTTWNFIPPALQVIEPKESECIYMIELFELIANSLQNDR